MFTTTPINLMRAAVSGNLYRVLDAHVTTHRLGRVLPGGLHYVLWKAAEQVGFSQVPDVSFLRPEKLNVFDRWLPYPGAPDFAFEAVTITEADMITMAKVRDYLAAGTIEVWIAYVGLGEIHRIHRDSPRLIRAYLPGDVLDGETLFPGLQVPISDLFTLI
ncbi:MAG: Uma2 family endonuclease [Anaerolineae bacterium]|jgi:Uma2 family endonuclease|nr:Uma2 family endonuclease [Anaerolineae bacterium]